MIRTALFAAALFAAALAAAGSAQARPALEAAAFARPPADSPAVKLSLGPEAAEAYALKRAGIARTAVEHRSDDVTGAIGFLCGRQDAAERTGAAAARGDDPHGRFLGAKLTLSFR
jgi:hypothetical protein